MKKQTHKKVFFILTLLISLHINGQNKEKWKIFHLDSLKSNEKNIFLNTPTIAASLTTINKNYTLRASKYDRVIFVLQGKGFATINNKKKTIKKGTVLFVKANDTILFLGNLKFMSWISKSTKTAHNFTSHIFSEEEITKERDTNENVWNRFINNSTMSLGLYMLPKIVGGDNTLNHEVDEINFVLNGTAKFKMNNTIINVKPGSIMWVKKGVGHYFYNLSEDFDVYILFEKTKKQ